MRERLKTLRRVLHVHELIEEMREIESRRAAAELREVEDVIRTQRALVQSAALDGRNALFGGDRMGWSLAVVQQEAAHKRDAQLASVLREKEQLSEVTRSQHLDSRQWSERMKRLTEQVEGSLEEMEDKRVQREADDRYLSRKRWRQPKEEW